MADRGVGGPCVEGVQKIVVDEIRGQFPVARTGELEAFGHLDRLGNGHDQPVAVAPGEDGQRILGGQFAGVVRDEPGTEIVTQRLDDPETGRWGTTRGGQYLHGEDAELRIVAVAVSGFSVDADGLVVADCDLQVDGVQFPVVGE